MILQQGDNNTEVVFINGGGLSGKRKVVSLGASLYEFPDEIGTTYVRTDDFVAGEAVFVPEGHDD